MLVPACLPARGDRIEVYNLQGYDLTRGAEYLGQSFMKDSLFR